ncbi:FHA domain-containing protein [Agarilytica rhodophyticola]|uniref:FHA domain-containing protein n=1 Tax=Agarilytica rhodophyticola TaxID=1737490 RepID=UPI00131A42BF|nr:FHA domain-containing protein [Agarilytica rhodophyticola]
MFKLKRIADNKEFILSEVSLLIGRSESCDICVSEGYPSREHARIVQKDEAVLVEDLHSTNGTFVNNQRIGSSALLNVGDVVKVGDEAFSIQSQSQPDATVLVKSLGSDENVSALVIEDDDEDHEDSTSLIHQYSLPRGWNQDGSNFISEIGKLDDRKKQAINSYIEKVRSKYKGHIGVLLILFSDDNPPVIKSLVYQEGGRSSWTFGRGDGCDVIFQHPCISMHHATLTYGEAGWHFEDSDSTNGISVQGKKLKTIKLQDEMKISVASAEIFIRFI